MARKVKAQIEGSEDAEITVAGRTVAHGAIPGASTSGEGADVELEAKNVKGGKIEVAGNDIIHFAEQVAEPLDALTDLLTQGVGLRFGHILKWQSGSDIPSALSGSVSELVCREDSSDPARIQTGPVAWSQRAALRQSCHHYA